MDERPAASPADRPVVLFDGVCNLCNGAVQFIIRRDPTGRFGFAPLDSAAARNLLAGAALPAPLPDSIVLVEPRPDLPPRVSVRSTAVLRIARGLRFPWPLVYALIVVPRPIRDWMYTRIARNRYRWFGKRDSCIMPTPDLRSRFIV